VLVAFAHESLTGLLFSLVRATPKDDVAATAADSTSPIRTECRMVWEELRTAVRFPMHVPIVLMVNGEEINAITVNISHNGVLLRVPQPIECDTQLEFLMSVPDEAFPDTSTAAIHCAGRVIRTYRENDSSFVALVIDEYQLQ
jgi:hypothetical protein